MDIKVLRDKYELIDLFCELVQIPSPSLQEDKVSKKIMEILKKNNINANLDLYGNIIAKVEATDLSKAPLLLSAHMDVVGDASAVNIRVESGFIETDKKRTLGADDKAGVAAAILLASEIVNQKNLKHGGLELVFTRDEEQFMSGIKNLDMKSLESEYILVLDADKLGQILVSGASFTKLTLNVNAFKGGHSGIDIADEERLNSVKLLAELLNEIPQGVYKKDELGVVTSINLGAAIGGGVETAILKVNEAEIELNKYSDFVLENSMTNIINTKAGAIYSIRSSHVESEKKLVSEIQQIVNSFNEKYEGLAKAEIEVEVHLLPFEKSDDKKLVEVAKATGQKLDVKLDISSFHAGAETHIYANNINKNGVKFKPCLVGLANVYNMHSSEEKIDYESYLKGYEFLKEFFKVYNSL